MLINISVFHCNINCIKIRLKRFIFEKKPFRSFTTCFRVTFDHWNEKAILSSELLTISLNDYKAGSGTLTLLNAQLRFDWKNKIPISRAFWNSVCVIYDSANASLKLTLNEHNVLDEVIKLPLEELTIQSEQIVFGGFQFAGQVADLNMWSRPLQDEEVLQFSTGG